MIKVTVMYPNTPGARFNHEYYRDKHMAGYLFGGPAKCSHCRRNILEKDSR